MLVRLLAAPGRPSQAGHTALLPGICGPQYGSGVDRRLERPGHATGRERAGMSAHGPGAHHQVEPASPGSSDRRMKAAVYTSYGPPDVVTITDVARPVPKEDEVLIAVRAASVNP